MKSYDIEQFIGFFGKEAVLAMESEFLIVMGYAEGHLNKATLSVEEWDYFCDIVDRLETLSAHNKGFTLKQYRMKANIFPYIRTRVKMKKAFRFDENLNLMANIKSLPREMHSSCYVIEA